MSDFNDEAQAALDKVREQMNAAATKEKAVMNSARPYMVAIAFGLGALLGFILGHVHL